MKLWLKQWHISSWSHLYTGSVWLRERCFQCFLLAVTMMTGNKSLGQATNKIMNGMIEFHDKSRRQLVLFKFFSATMPVAWGIMMNFLQSILMLIFGLTNKRPVSAYEEQNWLMSLSQETRTVDTRLMITSRGLHSTGAESWVTKGIWCQLNCPKNLITVTSWFNHSFAHSNFMTTLLSTWWNVGSPICTMNSRILS